MERELGVVGEAEVEIEAARLERAEEGRVRGPHGQVVQEDQQAAPAGPLLGACEGRGGEGEEEEQDAPRRRHCCADLAGFCWVWSGAAQQRRRRRPARGEEAIGAEVEREGAVPAVGLRSNGLDQFRALRTRSVQRGLSDRRSHMRQLAFSIFLSLFISWEKVLDFFSLNNSDFSGENFSKTMMEQFY